MASHHDLIVVGGGPGGYVAAIRAAQLGMKVALVEREHLGGVCLNWGCIPTKALLRSAEVLQTVRDEAAAHGVTVQGGVGVDLKAMVARSRAVAAQLQGGVRGLLRKNGVAVVEGRGRLAGPGTVAVEAAGGGATSELRAQHIVLATGARQRVLPGLEPDGDRIWSVRDAMTPRALPRSLLVVGAGAIGIEFACFYRALGVDVTVVEAAPRILPVEDHEIAALAQRAFERQGMRIHVATTVRSLDKRADGVAVVLGGEGGERALVVERVLPAVGIAANSARLGLEGTRVALDERGHVVVDAWAATGEPGVYAIGDLAGPPWLAHKASHEGVICVERIAGVEHVAPLVRERIPGCTYGRPQVASFGLTEQQAQAAGRAVRVGRFPFSASGKAIAVGDAHGLVKTIFDAASGELLGAHLVGPEVTELIHSLVAAASMEATEAELIHTVFAHPTLSEAVHESVLAAWGRALHV
jgi:dihydrolipoamide dehydrogenase